LKQQIKIAPGKLKTLTTKTTTINGTQNSPRQEQNVHGKSKTPRAKAKHSRQNQIKNSGQRLSKYVVTVALHNQQDVAIDFLFPGSLSVLNVDSPETCFAPIVDLVSTYFITFAVLVEKVSILLSIITVRRDLLEFFVFQTKF